TRSMPTSQAGSSSAECSMWYATFPCMRARFTSSRVFAEFFPPTTTITSVSPASSVAAFWRLTVTGHTVLKTLSSWLISATWPTSSLNAQGGWVADHLHPPRGEPLADLGVVDDLAEVEDRPAGLGRRFGELDGLFHPEAEPVLAREEHFHDPSVRAEPRSFGASPCSALAAL